MNNFNDSRVREELQAIGRVTIMITTLLFFALVGAWWFVQTDPVWIQNLIQSRPPLGRILQWSNYGRFALIPLFTMGFVTYMAGLFVDEIYGLVTPGLGLRFVLNTLFAFSFPDIRIRRGQMTAPIENIEMLERIGGPISLMIQADTAVLFQRTRTPGLSATNQGFFMAPFVRIDRMVSLEDQEGVRNEIKTVSRDGIQVSLTDVCFRYRILPADCDGRRLVRSIERPYSFEDNALREIAYNAANTSNGEDTWATMVGRMVVGYVIDFINLHTIDFLTAPRQDGRAPRDEVNRALNTQVQNQLQGVGAQLLWIDVGHIDIVDSAIDEDRTDLWAADWAGSANARRVFADAAQSALHDLGRAEAQAQMIMGITRSLQGLDLNVLPRDQLATMLLMRTGQLLEGFGQGKQQNQK